MTGILALQAGLSPVFAPKSRAGCALVGPSSDKPPFDQKAGLPERHRSIAIACVLAAMALVVLDAAIVNVALPTLAQSLHASEAPPLVACKAPHDWQARPQAL